MHTLLSASIILTALGVHANAENVDSVFQDAVAVWHMADLKDAVGKCSALAPGGKIQVGVELEGAQREHSLVRGGDGRVAVCDQGWLDAGQGADGELNLSGEAMTMLIRLRDPSGLWNTSLFSKCGGHDRLVYNLFTVNLGAGMDLGFELGIDGRKGMVQVKVPLATIGRTGWHDVIARYDGRLLQLFVDGVLVDGQPITGGLRQGNTEPVIVGGHSSGGKPQRPFRGRIDHAALWSRALSDAEIVGLSGGGETVRRRKEAVEAARWAGIPEPVAAFRKVVRSKDLEIFSQAALKLRRWMIENDPHRPIYHFTGPESWINDPNGPIYFQGKYHLFYQFDPIVDGRRSKRCWGHAVSEDLVHWADWPVALWPDTEHDVNGVYSGNTLIDDNGDLCALYTGNVAGHRETYGMLVRSSDGGLTFEKKMVMANQQRPNKDSPVHWDGFVWKEGDFWCQLIGGSTGGEGRQGAAMLWTSPDLEQWTFRRNIAPSIKRAAFWELPYLIPLGGKHVLMVGNRNPYWIGSYDKTTMIFTPDDPLPKMIDTGSYYSFNPNMVDDKGPAGTRRQLLHGWVTGPASPTKAVPCWQGAHSIPRVLNLDGERLIQQPIPEIEVLRGKHYEFDDLSDPHLLNNVKSDALEIIATFDPVGAEPCGFELRVAADGKAAATVVFHPTSRQFGINGLMQPSYLEPGEAVTMRVFLDRSIVEVYVNGCAQTARVFPPADALGAGVFSDGDGAKLRTLDVWNMKSMWE